MEGILLIFVTVGAPFDFGNTSISLKSNESIVLEDKMHFLMASFAAKRPAK